MERMPKKPGGRKRRASASRPVRRPHSDASPPPSPSVPDAQSLLDVAGVMFICLDARGRVALANRKACDVLGVAPAEILGKDWVDAFVPERLRAEVKTVFRRLMDGEVAPVDRFDNPVLTRSGEERLIAWRNVLLRDRDGRIAGTISSGEDVTELRRAEAALAESEARFRGFFDNAPVGKSITAPDGRLLRANPAFCAMLGYSPEEMARLSFAEITHPDDLPESRECIRSLLAGERDVWDMDKRYRTRDGRTVWAHVTTRLHRAPDGTPLFFLTHILDITAWRRAEAEASAWRQRFELATAASGQVAYQCDASTGEILWSGAVEQVFGYRPEEMRGGFAQWESLIHPDDRAGAIRTLAEAEAAHAPYDAEYRFRHKAGHYLRIRDRGFFAPATGSPNAIVGMMMDVSERTRREALTRALLALHDFACDHTLAELLRKVLDEIGNLTGSPIGFYHFVEPDQKTLALQAWSTRTEREFCKAEGRGRHYGIDEAGVWVDCIREGRPVIHNDYASLPHRKGMPLGHAPVIRELVVPVRRQNRLVAIVGVGNKPADYTEADLELVGHFADTTWELVERKRMEERLRESEAGLARAQLMAGLGSWDWDIRGNALRWSDEVYRIFGVGRDFPLTLESIVERIHPEDRDRNRAFVERLLGGAEPNEIELRVVRPDGSVRHIHQRVETRRGASGAVEAAFGTILDVTDRKAAEDRIRHLNSLLLAIRNVNQLIVHEKDPDALVAAACRLLMETRGYRATWIARLDAGGKVAGFAEAGLGAAASPLHARLKRGEMPSCCRIARDAADTVLMLDPPADCGDCPVAQEYRGDAALAARLEHDGRIHGVLATMLPRHFAEDKEERALFKEVAGDIAFALHAIQAEASRREATNQLLQSQRLEAIGRLAGGVAHEINNFLAVILGHADLAIRDTREGDPIRRRLGPILDAAERAAGVIRQLLAFGRKQVIQPRVLDLNTTVAGLAEMLRRLIGENLELSLRTAPEPAWIRADPGQIGQVLMNLVLNARDAMPGGGRLEIGIALCPPDRARSAGLPEGPCVELAVADTGRGLTPDKKAHLFEPFFTTKGPDRGTGLGLSIVHGIVTQSGGAIEVESEPGRGTTFRIVLPRSMEAPSGGDAPPPPRPSRGTETVLVVEDEEPVRRLVVEALRDAGYRVHEAPDGKTALQQAEAQGDLRLLISDAVMPRMSGRELAERLAERHPGLRVLFMSGYPSSALTPPGGGPLGAAFLQKPFTLDTLLRRVREVLDTGRAPDMPG